MICTSGKVGETVKRTQHQTSFFDFNLWAPNGSIAFMDWQMDDREYRALMTRHEAILLLNQISMFLDRTAIEASKSEVLSQLPR